MFQARMKRVNIAAPGEAMHNTGARIAQLREAQRRKRRSQTNGRDQMRCTAQWSWIELDVRQYKQEQKSPDSLLRRGTKGRQALGDKLLSLLCS